MGSPGVEPCYLAEGKQALACSREEHTSVQEKNFAVEAFAAKRRVYLFAVQNDERSYSLFLINFACVYSFYGSAFDAVSLSPGMVNRPFLVTGQAYTQ